MAIQTINIGNVVNDGLGDDLRSAFQKVNANFAELNSTLSVTASNIGTTGYGVFKQKTGANLEFKTISPGERISIVDNQDVLIISTDAAFKKIHTAQGEALATTNNVLTIEGSDNISVSASGSVVSIDTQLDIGSILTTYDFGAINGQFENVIQFLMTMSTTDFGSISSPSGVSLDLGSL